MINRFSVATLVLISTATIVLADIFVNVNIDKPVHDVSEQFVSFSIEPELLYGSLDGPNKKTLTDMAALLGPSYVKMTGDFFFPTDIQSTLKNPTQAIWSGFNRWTRAMNWTMIIPVQYRPQSWDPIDALRVLNVSNIIGIDNCVWQLGLDFAASRASDYVADLHTLDTMVDTFRPYINEWKIIGADITAGSSAEETKRYIDMSKDVNTAFGWNQPAAYHVEENVNGYIYDKDVALKAMMEKKVPVWLSLPAKGLINHTQSSAGIEVSEGVRWAQTLGDAASSGFSAVFKPLSEEDVGAPNYSFFVSALFKKIMGNRVFAARPVKRLSYSSKVYSHCANGISGGLAFMGVNTEDYAVKISVKPSAKFTGSEAWQFVLTSKKGVLYLNNEILTLNSTIEPLVKIKHPNKPLAMNIPPMSVGFWVLPLANHEDCQFTELLTNKETQFENRHRRQTSSDRLLKKLIVETSFTDQMKNRRRRDTSNTLNQKSTSSNTANTVTRHRRFILQETPGANIANQKAATEERNLKKRENAQQWLQTLVLNPLLPNPLLPSQLLPKINWNMKRSRRATDFLTTMFPSKSSGNAKASSSRRQPASLKSKAEQDETSIFKSTKESAFPEGDVHFEHITDQNGEEMPLKESREESEEEKLPKLHFRELPSEFYETIDHGKYQPRPFEYQHTAKPEVSEVSDVSDIEGQTKYITRDQLENHSQEGQVKNTNSKHFFKDSSEKSTPSSYPFTVESSMAPASALSSEPEENDNNALKAYLGATKSSSEWQTDERIKRSIGSGKYAYKTIKDNLIEQEENIEPFTYNNSHMKETVLEESVLATGGSEGNVTVKSKISKIFGVVKNHLNDFFNTFIN